MAILIILGAAVFFSCSPGVNRLSSPVEIGEFERIRICSENLNRFAEPVAAKSASSGTASKKRRYRETEEEQLHSLVLRMSEGRCDLIAVQEVIGKSRREAEANLEKLAKHLEELTRRPFAVYAGTSEDPWIRNGFLVARDLSSDVRFKSYDDVPLSRLVAYGPVGNFQRPPVSVRLMVARKGKGNAPIPLLVFNIHFKSRSFGFKDVLHTNYEALRMEMAETSRRLFLAELETLGSGAMGVLLGDRNGDRQSAGAQILSGARLLADFQKGGDCILDRKGEGDCGPTAPRKPLLRPLLEEENHRSSASLLTYRYKGRMEVLDEIYVPERTAAPARGPGGRLEVGVQGTFQRGSDHLLTWVELGLISQ